MSNYLFEVFRALVRPVKWSGVSGVDSPGSVRGPHSVNVLSSVRHAQTSTIGCSFNGPRCLQSLQKALHTTLAPFLV